LSVIQREFRFSRAFAGIRPQLAGNLTGCC